MTLDGDVCSSVATKHNDGTKQVELYAGATGRAFGGLLQASPSVAEPRAHQLASMPRRWDLTSSTRKMSWKETGVQ